MLVAAPLKVSVVPLPVADGVIFPEMPSVPAGAGRTSTTLKLYRSVVGDVSLIVTAVPLNGIGALCICIQYVSPDVEKYSCKIVWLGPTTLAMALSQSLPTPSTMELLRVVVSEAVGAPEAALALAVAPIAPDPFVPEVSTPAKLMTSIDETTFCERVAVTKTLLSGFGANARQISAVPSCVFVRSTKFQVNPAVVILVTVALADNASVPTSAKISSFPAEVENALLVTVVAAVA